MAWTDDVDSQLENSRLALTDKPLTLHGDMRASYCDAATTCGRCQDLVSAWSTLQTTIMSGQVATEAEKKCEEALISAQSAAATIRTHRCRANFEASMDRLPK